MQDLRRPLAERMVTQAVSGMVRIVVVTVGVSRAVIVNRSPARLRAGHRRVEERPPRAPFNQACVWPRSSPPDLLCWLTLLLCLDASLADAEPKTLRYRLLHTAARIVRGPRKRTIKIPETWPRVDELADASTPPSH